MSEAACLDQKMRALLLAIVPIIVLELELVLGFFEWPMRSSFCPREQLSCRFSFREVRSSGVFADDE